METTRKPHISVCICTYKRPELLRLLLLKLREQITDGAFSYSVVVADNDSEETARKVVEEFSGSESLPVFYYTEPRKNIALVRNKAVGNAAGDYLAFIDDDELPENLWLSTLLVTLEKYGVDAVLAPVRPRFEHEPPAWVTKGRFFDRPEYATGRDLKSGECRTGNVLIRKKSLECLETPFDERFGSGSEDVDFFRRLMAHGKKAIWCNEAPAYELIPPQRCSRRYQIRLALLRGGNSFKHRNSRLKGIVKALLALPFYCCALPILYLLGEQYFMKYLIKVCDHFGRLMRAFGIVLVRQRAL
jgi:succinoglycan biosynthesis protein ExoM